MSSLIKSKTYNNLSESKSDLCFCIGLTSTKEHVIIGSQSAIMDYLCDGPIKDIIYNKKSDLGQLFIDLHYFDPSTYDNLIYDLESKMPTPYPRSKESELFTEKELTSNSPLSQYYITCTRKIYHTHKKYKRSSKDLEKIFKREVRDLFYGSEATIDFSGINAKNIPFFTAPKFYNIRTQNILTTWSPDTDRKKEYVFASGSLFALYQFYLNYLVANNIKYQQCKICGKIFTVTNLNKKICSTDCNRINDAQKQSAFLKNADNAKEAIYEKHRQNWYRHKDTFIAKEERKVQKENIDTNEQKKRIDLINQNFNSVYDSIRECAKTYKKTSPYDEFSAILNVLSNIEKRIHNILHMEFYDYSYINKSLIFPELLANTTKYIAAYLSDNTHNSDVISLQNDVKKIESCISHINTINKHNKIKSRDIQLSFNHTNAVSLKLQHNLEFIVHTLNIQPTVSLESILSMLIDNIEQPLNNLKELYDEKSI